MLSLLSKPEIFSDSIAPFHGINRLPRLTIFRKAIPSIIQNGVTHPIMTKYDVPAPAVILSVIDNTKNTDITTHDIKWKTGIIGNRRFDAGSPLNFLFLISINRYFLQSLVIWMKIATLENTTKLSTMINELTTPPQEYGTGNQSISHFFAGCFVSLRFSFLSLTRFYLKMHAPNTSSVNNPSGQPVVFILSKFT